MGRLGWRSALFPGRLPFGPFAPQWKFRLAAQEEALKEAASGKLRRLLAYNKSFLCTDVRIVDTALFHEAVNWKNAPGWRRPARISDVGETRVTVEFQSQTRKVARQRVRKKGETQDVGEAE